VSNLNMQLEHILQSAVEAETCRRKFVRPLCPWHHVPLFATALLRRSEGVGEASTVTAFGKEGCNSSRRRFLTNV
jgi:hypothetical protein